MTRQDDVFKKLDYADHKFTELGNAIFDSGIEETEVKFLGEMAGEVLANCREVFDYCANDIADVHIASNDAEFAARLASGKARCYYPQYKSQLTKKESVFFKLKSLNKPLHDHLFSIAAAIEKNAIRPKTNCNYGALRDMAEMVNRKKHDKLLGVEEAGGETIYTEMQGMKLMIPKEKQVGYDYMNFPPDAKHTVGQTYVFEENKEDVMEFPMKCRVLTRLIMDDIYNDYLL